MTTETIDKAASGGDLMTWGIMFGLLTAITIGLAIWDKKSREDDK
jgi:hypothetical protein